MLVGVKTVTDADGKLKFPSWVNRGLDTDVIVSEVRETSRKPDEVYGMIERMCPGGRKIEIFGRKHNTRPGYVILQVVTRRRHRSSVLTSDGSLSEINWARIKYSRKISQRGLRPGLLFLCYISGIRRMLTCWKVP